jgi:hypothetical protein
VEALKSKVNELFLFLEAASKVGCYLKEEAAAMMLDKIPPVNLLTLETKLLTSLTSLEKISLTRHSESQTWQSNYLKLLEALPADAFETRTVNHNIIDKRKFAQIMDTSDMKQKPWRMSHAKETGFVNIFTHDSDSILGGTPSIQFVTVLFHYYYETLYAGQFSLSNSEADRSRLLAQVISTREDKFPFFHPNCYTEHLYWKHALESFTLYTKDHLDVSFFAHTLSCGGYLNEPDPNGPISLNLIDHIWNLNIVNDIEKQSYFQFSNSSFLYHFREGLWYEILLDMVGTSSEEMQAYLKSHLHLGDQALTRAILLKK